jgi:uncharacterized OB-fold protein
MKTRKIVIKATGSQAPYGIDETIDIIPAAHYLKIKALQSRYYNPPRLYCDRCGAEVEVEHDVEYERNTHKTCIVGISRCDCEL